MKKQKQELKTLKDIFPYESFEYEMDTYDDELKVQKMIIHTLKNVKAEAIKIINAPRLEAFFDKVNQDKLEGMKIGFKWFFNITEEDLK